MPGIKGSALQKKYLQLTSQNEAIDYGSNLKFPSDLGEHGSDDTPGGYSGKITFRSFATEPPDPGNIGSDFLQGAKNLTDNLLTEAAEATGEAFRSFFGFKSPPNYSPPGTGTVRANVSQSYPTDTESYYSGRAKFTGRSVSLYMPPAIQIGDRIDIDNTVSFGTFGEALDRSLGSGGGLSSALMNATSASTESIVAALGGQGLSPELVRLGLSKAAGVLSNNASGVVRTALGVTPNPNIRAVFRSVGLRSFNLSFKLTPRSYKEAMTIGRIIKFFRTNAYPETFLVAGLPAGYYFPNKFKIHFQYGEKEVATKTHLSYLTDIQTTYNPQSMSFYEGGHFQEIDLSLTFIEERTVDRQQVEEGF
jgi:hypothetical protein